LKQELTRFKGNNGNGLVGDDLSGAGSNSNPRVISPNPNPNAPNPNSNSPPVNSPNTPNSPQDDSSNTQGSPSTDPSATTNNSTPISTTIKIPPGSRGQDDDDTPNLALIIGLVSSAAFILAAILLLLLYKRRKRKTWPTEEDGAVLGSQPKPEPIMPLLSSSNIVSDNPPKVDVVLTETPLLRVMPVAIKPFLARAGSTATASSKISSPRSDTSVPLPEIKSGDLRNIDAERNVRVEGGVLGAGLVGGVYSLKKGDTVCEVANF
jgi:hypothetical protein